ncbi:MAG: hypothetical protein WAT86_00745, partial [Flavobacteriales bacterium]
MRSRKRLRYMVVQIERTGHPCPITHRSNRTKQEWFGSATILLRECAFDDRSVQMAPVDLASITEHARSILRWTPLGEWHSEQEIQVVIFGDETCSQWIAFM